MSVIAWDGKSLAADRQGTNGGLCYSTSKIKRLPDGTVLAWCGHLDYAIALCKWYERGAKEEDWPKFQEHDDHWAVLIVAKPDGVRWYEQERHPIPVEDKFMAWGSGKELAIGALAMDATAEQAVEVASRFNSGCGRGVDVYAVAEESA